MAQGYWEEGMPSSNPEGVAGRAPVAWRLSRTTCRSSAPRAARARWRGRAEWESERESERESRSGCEVLSQMQMERGAEGLRRVQRGRGAAGPRERRDHMPGGGTARTTRRRCHSCREWMRERSGGILQALGSISDATVSLLSQDLVSSSSLAGRRVGRSRGGGAGGWGSTAAAARASHGQDEGRRGGGGEGGRGGGGGRFAEAEPWLREREREMP